MDTLSPPIKQKESFRLFVDICLPVCLLLAVLSVLNFDRSKPVEIVFILDQRIAMRDLIPGIKANTVEKAVAFKASGLECRFAVIPFGAKRYRIPVIPLTDDLTLFKERLTAQQEPGGTEAAASCAAALSQALQLDFRKNAEVHFYLMSKTPVKDSSEILALAKQMEERGITAIVQADATEKDKCQPLYQNGQFFSMDGDDLTGVGKRPKSRAVSLLAPEKQGNTQLAKAKGIYGMRTDPDRQKKIGKLGGTAESELAVQVGLEWLSRHQDDNGSWSDGGKCERGKPACQNLKYGAPIAETGLAVLAFQAGGNYYFNDQEYSINVKRGLDWLVKKQERDGRLFGPQHTSWYEHGIGTFALAEACAVALANHQTPDPRYLDAATRAIRFMEEHQYQQGGWQYSLDSAGIGDTSVTGWQMLALKSAMEANIDVKTQTIELIRKFFESCGDPQTGRTGYQSRGGGTDLTTAVGLIAQEFVLKQEKSPLALKAIEYLRQRSTQNIGQSGDFYSLYNCTLSMFLAQGEAWVEWNSHVRDAIVKRQEKTGCARGSWGNTSQSGVAEPYHRTLNTAWAVLTLEVYYRYSTEHVD